jgi:HEAT repeat protein
MVKEIGLNESFAHDITALLESFSEKDTAGKQSLSQLFVSDPRTFAASATAVLAKSQPSPGCRYLVHLLMKGKMLPASLLDLRATDARVALGALQAVTANGTNLQPMLELALNKALLDQSNPENSQRILRLLELLAAIAPPTFWNSFQLELMAHPDRTVRSKAALIIGRSSKNAAWIGRRFMDRDARVQASAVEALWALEPEDSRPLLLTASKSKHNRVAANAALGLYRIGDLKVVRMLLDMVRQREAPAFRMSALWAMGETQDPRFLPFLMEQFKTSDGKLRLAVTRAMGSIRRREKANGEAGTLRFRVSQARASQDGQRHFSLVLSSEPTRDLSALTPLDFALWEAGELIEKYEVKLTGAPAALVAGFVAPRFTSTDDAYGQAIHLALKRSSASKRADDMWRIDRYSMEPPKDVAEAAPQQSFLPYDDSLATQEVKMRHCFIASPDILSKVIAAEVPRDRVAPDLVAAIQRQCEAISKHSGKRHVFVFLHEAAVLEGNRVSALKTLVASERIVLHGFAPGLSEGCAAFRDLCLSIPDGTFNDVPPDGLPDALGETYALLMNGCEISYEFRPGEAQTAMLKVSSRFGSGQVDIPWPPEAAVEAVAPTETKAPVETEAPVEAAAP